MYRIIVFLILFIPFFIFGQKKDTISRKMIKQMKREMAKKSINELKNGVLLVQLKTKHKSIEALKKRGFIQRAEKIRKEQEEDNRNIIKGFNEYYDFSPVYFFYSNDKKKVENHQFDSVQFITLDSNTLMNLPDTSSIYRKLDTANYYIAEFGTNNYSNSTLRYLPNFDDQYDRGLEFEALLIKNKDYLQLSHPFPYYVKTNEGIKVGDLKRWETIKKMNQKLHYFYNNQ